MAHDRNMEDIMYKCADAIRKDIDNEYSEYEGVDQFTEMEDIVHSIDVVISIIEGEPKIVIEYDSGYAGAGIIVNNINSEPESVIKLMVGLDSALNRMKKIFCRSSDRI